MTTAKKVIIVVSSMIGVVALFIGGIAANFYFRTNSTVINKPSPDRPHTAKLDRAQLIDVNFRVAVDGREIYRSPDFAPIRADFREQLVWDTNSQVVVLEVAGRRIFGHHAVDKRPLTDSEILKVQFTPFDQLRYEGTLPKDTVTR